MTSALPALTALDNLKAEIESLADRAADAEAAAGRLMLYEYPPAPNVEIIGRRFDPALGHVDCEIRLSFASFATVYAFVRTQNGTAYSNVDKGHYIAESFIVQFLPGEVSKIVRVRLGPLKWKEGATFLLYQPTVATGHVSDRRTNATFTAARPADTAPLPASAAPAREWRQGAADFALDIPAMQWSDEPEPGKWLTRPSHGRTQDSNGETGYYMPDDGVSFRKSEEGLHIVSRQLATPMKSGSKSYPHGAAMLSGLHLPEAQTRYGAYEIEAKMPAAKGSWPAFWLIGTKGWPPEIDIVEIMNFLPTAVPDKAVTAHIHQGPKGTRLYAIGAGLGEKSPFSGLTTGFHTYGVTIEPDWITWFVDHTEFWRARNPFLQDDAWYPLMNVGVRHAGAYDGGEMVVRAMRMWKRT